jgi:hypothetical protein
MANRLNTTHTAGTQATPLTAGTRAACRAHMVGKTDHTATPLTTPHITPLILTNTLEIENFYIIFSTNENYNYNRIDISCKRAEPALGKRGARERAADPARRPGDLPAVQGQRRKFTR